MRKLITAGAAAGAALQFGCGPYAKDPLPDPFVCPSPAYPHPVYEQVGVSAHWGNDGTNWLVSVSVAAYAPYGDPLAFSGDPVLTDATMIHLTRTERDIDFVCQPNDDASTVDFTVPVDCAGYEHILTYEMDVSGEREVQRTVPVVPLPD